LWITNEAGDKLSSNKISSWFQYNLICHKSICLVFFKKYFLILS
jgi:hypothetical protein